MPAKDSERRKEIARLGALAQHRKHGCLIPIEARRRGGRVSGSKYGGREHQYHGVAERFFDKWAESQGYIIYKNGFPDRAIVKNGKVVFVEVKRPRESLSKAQKRMRDLFRKIGLEIITWRPNLEDLPQRVQDNIRLGKGIHGKLMPR